MSTHRRRPTRSEVTTASAAGTRLLRRLHRDSPGVHPEIWARWLDIAGDQMYRRTFPVRFLRKVLTVGVANSTWLQQLSLLKETLQNRLDEEVGPGVVTDIRFVLDPSVGKRPGLDRPAPSPAPSVGDDPLPVELQATVETMNDDTLAESIRRAFHASMKKQPQG